MPIRVFTDGACSNNGRPGAKAGYAVWFPDHRDLSYSQRIPPTESQTNQRAEMCAIRQAVRILEQKGFLNEDIVIYTDSEYSMNCLTKWITGWISRGWKTAEGKDVLHRDVIEETSGKLAKFKSYRFHHVRAHTGGGDDISQNNDVVDRMARASIEDKPIVVEAPVVDELFPRCPVRLLGPPVRQPDIVRWMRESLDTLDKEIIDKHMMKAFTELCKNRDVNLTKQIIQRVPMIRAERGHLQITHVEVEKTE